MAATPQTIHIHNHPARGSWWTRLLLVLLLISVILNGTQLASYRDYQRGASPPYESFDSGTMSSPDKIALLEVEGVIMPPYTDRILKEIERIAEDDQVRGVVLAIDSPGGLVADSHRIYKQLVKLRDKKPMIVSMGRIAASGGYYIAMGAGPESKILAEEVTWTGSIGVIIPRYDLSELAAKVGLQSDALKTGPLKDSLDPFRPLSDDERKVWDTIIEESLAEFIHVIDDGRATLTEAEIRKVATGQVFTASQAKSLKLVDDIGDQDDAIELLKQQLNLTEARIVRYERPQSLAESLLGIQALEVPQSLDPLGRLLEAGVPRAMYLFGWQTGLSSP
ncbi:MAG: signal peptide peptidase SppA [Planctomycetaceae bacterium]